MRKTYYLLLSLFILSLTFSCDVIEKDNFTDPEADFPWVGKKVLIEDFTGYKCTNCPQASSELKTIEELYPGKVIGIAMMQKEYWNPEQNIKVVVNGHNCVGKVCDLPFI